MAMMVRELFPRSPIKYMPPTKHKEGDIFFSHAYDVMADLVAITTRQGIQLLGMMTEAMHNPFLMDRYVALKSAAYVYRAARHLGDEIASSPTASSRAASARCSTRRSRCWRRWPRTA